MEQRSRKNPSKKSKHPLKTLQKQSRKPFKSKGRVNDEGKSQKIVPHQVEDDDPAFPRGGGSSLSIEELGEVHAEVDAEFEAEGRVLKKREKKQAHKRSLPTQDDFASLFGGGITGKLPRFANRITMKNVSPGMKLLGVITEVNEKDIVVSLPGGIRGLVSGHEAFDTLSEDVPNGDAEGNYLSSFYHVGQLISCIVLKVDDDKKDNCKRKIWLSLRLALLHKSLTFDVIQEGMVLSAYVKSIEDHGFILDFGLASYTGFMPKNENIHPTVNSGKMLQGVVQSVDKARKVVYLSSDPDMVSRYVTKDLKGISIDLLVPGMMVNARVQSTLENGIMLSFLTYFTGTVDVFNLQKTLPTSSWKDDYSQNKKVNARILFVDPSTRAVGLTLNPHLLNNRAPPSVVKTGDIFDHSKVIRVDRGLGLLLEIPSSPIPTPAYVGMSDVSDKEVHKLEKSFKAGSTVRVRVLGFRHLEGLATGVLKTSAFEGSVFTHSDVKPGMVVKAKVIVAGSFGAIVQCASGVKALCPLRHMSEFEIQKPRKKFQVGAEFVFRVLGCKSKRITVTHKKTLVKSKLVILSSYADANEGLIAHGWISKVEKHGCFVRFYNGVQGFAPRSELGLDPGSDTSSMYHVEQVVKCRVVSSLPASRHINLSFIMRPSRVLKDDMVKLGSLVSGVVDRVTPSAIIVHVKSKDYIKGTISSEHLADHHGLAALLMTVLKPGFEFDQLLVLDIESNSLILSAKYSLTNSAQELPLDVTQVRPHSLVHGYICNIIDTGCFVRFLGRLTGFAPKKKGIDDRRSDISNMFFVGQSVRCNILDVNTETSRITLSLKQSLCSSTDASFIQEYFLLEEKVAKLQMSDSNGSGLEWVNDFDIGRVTKGKVQEIKDFGAVISFPKYNDVFGFVTHHQLGGINLETGSSVSAAVLDVSKIERLVDLSLKPEFVEQFKDGNSIARAQKKKRKREAYLNLELHQTVKATVEIVKDNYLVLSIPKYNCALGYASLSDYNTQRFPHQQFVHGQSVIATVMGLPSHSTAGRCLLLLKSICDALETSSSKRARKKAGYDVGSVVEAEITEIKPLELRLKFGTHFHGRVHITEANDDNAVSNPFSNFRIGQTLTGKIVANGTENNRTSHLWEFSIRPSILAGSVSDGEKLVGEDFTTGQKVSGFVYKVDRDWIWLTISRGVTAQLYILDSSCEVTELENFQNRFRVGDSISGYVFSYNKEKKLLRVVLRPLVSHSDGKLICKDDESGLSNEHLKSHFREGDIVAGRISKIFPGVGGLLVQIAPNLYGKVHYTEMNDLWVPNPLSGYRVAQFIKCKVQEISVVQGNVHVDLSLRTSSNMPDQKLAESNDMQFAKKRVERIEEVHPDMVVQGYVKNVTSKGCFIMLSRKLDARILLSNLSDEFVQNPEREFPIGKLVAGKVVSVETSSMRVDVSLRTSNTTNVPMSDINALQSLHVGDIILGRIKSVQKYGLFISIGLTNIVGLCHLSEVSDDHIDDIETKYSVGDEVKCKVLKVDEDRRRIALGMKKSYFRDHTDIESPSTDLINDTVGENSRLTMSTLNNSSGMHKFETECENLDNPVPSGVESTASGVPLVVPLDDTENSDIDVSQNIEHVNDSGTQDGKAKRLENKKAKKEREQEIRAAEERLLEKDIPRSADEFEKVVRSSPNSSFVWIKYMAFMLSMSDVEKARSIAERALRTINIREETEKLNIWVAYFNLENEYGNPPEETVVKLFQRALRYCDPKKLHLALLGMYERTEQHKLADELLEKMVKKFKQSCKVWLRRVQCILKQNQDGVQSIVNRALLCLPRHKHIKFITQEAILEFKCGVSDRGRSMFEGMLREYPKRTDLWNVYLDQEIRIGDVDVIRALFERATSLSLPPKKMKFLFRKYLDYEKSQGDEERIESVKNAAMEYVKSLA